MNEKAKALVERFDGKYTFEDLITIMEILRSDGGCPWDREQTHESIRKHFIEETYEVIEAIDKSDSALLREELGDVLLQVVFHSRISEENGDFDFSDVADEICRKMIVRHPHIFSDVTADTTEEVLTNWESIKASTKKRESTHDRLDSVAKTLPSLMRAQKLAGKMKKEGVATPLEILVGDALFDIVALCQEAGIDAEKALYDACERRISETE